MPNSSVSNNTMYRLQPDCVPLYFSQLLKMQFHSAPACNTYVTVCAKGQGFHGHVGMGPRLGKHLLFCVGQFVIIVRDEAKAS